MSCGITEDEIKERLALKEQIKKLDINRCKRCDDKPFVILQKKDIFCRICFKEYCEHKFRSTIGRSKLIKSDHKILVAFSGGQNSVATLDLCLKTLNHRNPVLKFLMEPYLLYIDGRFSFNNKM
jgi:cytoplasmic tRNA 2-thiolation protein 2